MKQLLQLFFALFLLINSETNAQSMIDVSVGTSHQDNFFTNLAYRRTVSDKFRIGAEFQYGAPKYRLIEAKPIRKGYAATIAVPLTLRMYEKDQIRMDFYTKAGIRLQGATDPFDTGAADSTLTSTALNFEAGLLLTVKVNEKLNLQSGVTFPVFYQFSPSVIFENVYPGMLHLGGNYMISEKSTVFVKTVFGAALGGSGDTQKFGWSHQVGLRINLGERPNANFVEPSF